MMLEPAVPVTAAKSPASAAGRVVHAIFFFGFAAITLAATHVELLQLWRGLMQPFHSGTPPSVMPTASGVVAALGVLVILGCLAFGRSVPLVVSGLMLAAVGGGLFPFVDPDEVRAPTERSVPGANLKMLEAARSVHEQLNAKLQTTGKLPYDIELPTFLCPYRRKGFATLPTASRARPGAPMRCPTAPPRVRILLNATDDRVSFTLSAVGIDSHGEPAILRDEHGVAVELRGVFNPDTAG